MPRPGEGHRCGTALENGDFETESVRVVDARVGVTRGTSLISVMSVGECSLEIYDDVVQGIERRTL